MFCFCLNISNREIRTNLEVEELIGNEDIVDFIKSMRLRWLGHVERNAKEDNLM